MMPSADVSGEPPGRGASSQPPVRTKPRDLPLLAALVFAGLPSLLVFMERWVGDGSIADLLTPFWCDLLRACPSPWPPTILLIVPSILGAVFLVARRPLIRLLPEPEAPHVPTASNPCGIQRRIFGGALALCGLAMATVIVRSAVAGNPPGWDYAVLYLGLMASAILHEVPGRRIAVAVLEALRKGAAPLAAHVLLVAALFAAVQDWQGAPILLALAAGGLFLLWRARGSSLSPAFWLMSASLVLGSLDLSAWWFAVIGDEYAFYAYAVRILSGANGASLGAELYNVSGVYATHPGFSSLIQAAFMAVFGQGLFGWRFSNVYLVGLSHWPFYSFARAIGGRRFAVIAGALLAASHYLMSFSKIGYNNLQALFAFALCLAGGVSFARNMSRLAAAGFGAALGLTFYVFPGALLTLPVALLIPVMRGPRRVSPGRWLIVGAVFLATALPLVVQPGFWATKWAGMVWGVPTTVSHWSSTASVVVRNLGLAALSFLRSAGETHFVAVGFVDFITAILVVLGVGALLHPPLDRRAGTLLAGLAILLLSAGALHSYPFPPTTRMFLVLPWLLMVAAIGLRWVEGILDERGLSRRAVRRVTAGVLGLVLVANLVQAYPLSRYRMAQLYQWPHALLLREQENLLPPGPNGARLLILSMPESPYRDSLVEILRLHGVRFDEASLEAGDVLEVADAVLRDPRVMVMVERGVPDGVQTVLETRLTAAGKSACRFRNSIGEVRLVVWMSPAEQYRCSGAATRW